VPLARSGTEAVSAITHMSMRSEKWHFLDPENALALMIFIQIQGSTIPFKEYVHTKSDIISALIVLILTVTSLLGTSSFRIRDCVTANASMDKFVIKLSYTVQLVFLSRVSNHKFI
jgi:hypothetical protein